MSWELMVAEAIHKDREREMKGLMRHTRDRKDHQSMGTATQRLPAFRSLLPRRGVRRPATL